MKVNPKSCIKTSGVHLLLYSILQKLRQRRNNFSRLFYFIIYPLPLARHPLYLDAAGLIRPLLSPGNPAPDIHGKPHV